MRILKNKKHILFFLIILGIVIISIIFITKQDPDYSDISCINKEDIEFYEPPIPVVWDAELDGCLSGCQGASFTRVPENNEYDHPRFSGYLASNWDQDGNYSGNEIIKEEYREENITLRIYGNLLSINEDHANNVFEGRCVPDLDITKIEIIS